MRRKIPSSVALAAFEAAARHESFTEAARELSVTQSAVCRQVAALESFLGLELFTRTRRGVVLTEAGSNYSRQVRARLAEIEQDAISVMSHGGHGGALELGVVPTFATRWLMPRLREFSLLHPDITINLTPRTRPFLFDETGIDAAIHAGESKWPGTEGVFLMRESLVAVACPALVARPQSIEPGAFEDVPLLQQATRPYAWRSWFASLGLRVENDLAGPRMELFSMLTQAAVHGLGAALIPRFLIEEELRQGLLVPLVEHRYFGDRSYYLIYPEYKAQNPLLRAFRSWLDTAAHAYRIEAGLDEIDVPERPSAERASPRSAPEDGRTGYTDP
ncbi:MAG: LysR family transcriptional regulator [Burkholderiaceae bacterium]|nr:LysR family transcriptional regulator [Burkholderiaceae bacterium]